MAKDPGRKARPTVRAQVVRKEWLTPHMLRVTVGGAGLRAYVHNEFTDRYVKLLFPQPGVEYPEPFDLQTIRAELPRVQWPVSRTYTIRSYDPEAQELAIDFVYHGDEGLAGPWAVNAEPGDALLFSGPGGAYAPDPAASWHLMVGDESALPAIGAALEALPSGAVAHVFVEVANDTEEQRLETPGQAEITWVHRDDSPRDPGVELVETVRSLAFPPGAMQAFVHGEARIFRELRRYLRTERGLSTGMESISGYWRRGTNEDGWQAEKAAEKRRAEADRDAETR